MKVTLLSMAILVGSICFAGRARADVITFDDLSASEAPITGVYHGLTWTNFWVLNTTSLGPSGYVNGTVSKPNVAFNAAGAPALTAGSAFTFNSAYFTGAWNDGLSITVVGKALGVTLDSITFVVGTSSPTLETFGWSGIDELDFSSGGGTPHGYAGSGTQFAMDNMTINGSSAVPEPRLLLPLIAGFFGLISFHRFRLKRRPEAN
jgi:hypothetical protein